MTSLLLPLHLLQAALSLYALAPSGLAIAQLQRYEPRVARAAKYSNTAEHELWKTRWTQGAGLVAILTSLATALALAWRTSADHPPRLSLLAWHGLSAAATLGVRAYMRDFWATSARVPGQGPYNDAVRATERVMGMLGWIGAGWVIAGGVAGYRAVVARG